MRRSRGRRAGPGFASPTRRSPCSATRAAPTVDVAASLDAARTPYAVVATTASAASSTSWTRGSGLPGWRRRGAGAARRAHPRDALAVSAAVPTIAFSGVTDVQQEAWDLVEGLAPAYGDDWWYSSLLAFVRQDQGRYDEAGGWPRRRWRRARGRSCGACADPRVLRDRCARCGPAVAGPVDRHLRRAGQHRAHFSWHAALHELSTGDLEAVRRRYARSSRRRTSPAYARLVDSASLLWRCRVTDSWAGRPAGRRRARATLAPSSSSGRRRRSPRCTRRSR